MQKANYATPELHVYGNIEQLTHVIDKTTGYTDGVSYQGTPIGTTSDPKYPPSSSGGGT